MWLTKKQWKLRMEKLKKVKLPKSSDKDRIEKLPEAEAVKDEDSLLNSSLSYNIRKDIRRSQLIKKLMQDN